MDIPDRPVLQDSNTLLRPRYTIIVRFYVGPKYVYIADIFILIYNFYVIRCSLSKKCKKFDPYKILPTFIVIKKGIQLNNRKLVNTILYAETASVV